MSICAVEGAAGCGKTYRLMEMLSEELTTGPLKDGQRVLALTFMHGSRRRLAERLALVNGMRRRVECCTIDGFAWRLVRRWRALATALGVPPIGEAQFDIVCDTAGILLEQPEVCRWVASSFPIILVDEGQDLKTERLRILQALSTAARILIAADEFQCLDQQLRPNPLVDWLQRAAPPENLRQVRRTNDAGLLAAAAAIREGRAPVAADGFRISPGASVPLASTYLANAIAWRRGGNVAVITPALQGGFAQSIVTSVGSRSFGKHNNGPYAIHWEGSERDEAGHIIRDLNLTPVASAQETIIALRRLQVCSPVRSALSWVENQIHAMGRVEFDRATIEDIILQQVSLRRQRGASQPHIFTALTVQQAKNREFEGVVILWPFQVGGDDEHKRRLLYNAITRARRWCHVIVQSPKILQAAPFA